LSASTTTATRCNRVFSKKGRLLTHPRRGNGSTLPRRLVYLPPGSDADGALTWTRVPTARGASHASPVSRLAEVARMIVAAAEIGG